MSKALARHCPLCVAGLLLAGLLLPGCMPEEKREPSTPEEMYAEAERLIKPNVAGDESDFAGAMRWLRKAAEGGLLRAQLDLGGIYMAGGKGVKPDGAQAMRWFALAAEQGSVEAHLFMGLLLYHGTGVAEDREAALAHWRTAAEGGVAEAQYRLGHVLAQKSETAAEGVDWLVKAVREGSADGVSEAACDLGYLFATGAAGEEPDMEKAAHWYAVAADGGLAKAQYVYALMLLEGEGAQADAARGLSYLKLAAGQDHPPAIARLVNYLRNKEDATPQDKEEAEAWAQRLDQLGKRVAPKAEQDSRKP